ncbi:MAG TPA: hypothetical protein VMV72_13205 [Verrucomicrobiae bacterium]|nr:hypothetical protein [Verrucomicrobiae bacterium]
MKAWTMFVGILMLGATCQARLGEVEQQVAQRYGAPQSCADPSPKQGYRVCHYESQGLEIVVHYGTSKQSREGRSAAGLSLWESYTSPGTLSEDAVQTILDANKGASVWSHGEDKVDNDTGNYRLWKTADHTRVAKLFTRQDRKRQLVVEWVDVTPPPKGF